MSSLARPDGCTGIPWRTSFEECCDQHDIAYIEGGSKIEADWVLRQCIRASGRPVAAWVVWGFVSTLGWLFWGWQRLRG